MGHLYEETGRMGVVHLYEETRVGSRWVWLGSYVWVVHLGI